MTTREKIEAMISRTEAQIRCTQEELKRDLEDLQYEATHQHDFYGITHSAERIHTAEQELKEYKERLKMLEWLLEE